MSQNVLVIESEPWLGDRYQSALEKGGFGVIRASNAYTAMDLIDDNPPIAIVMNLLLDGPGAIGLLHELQSYVDTASVPVIVCSSSPNLDVEELRPYGVHRLVNSSVMRPADLAATVRSVMA